VCGDLNVAAAPIDLRYPQRNEGSAGFTPEERAEFAKLLSSGFIDTFRYLHPDKQEFSWWSYMYHAREKNIGWRLDYFLLSEFAKDKICDAQILTDVHGSDHAPILLEIDI
jgi:exodeoxyribonuclease-3